MVGDFWISHNLFVMDTNASSTSIGVVLNQAGHPITYYSQKLGPIVQRQPTYVSEFQVIIVALAKFHP